MEIAIYSCNGFGREVAYIARDMVGFRNEIEGLKGDVVWVDDDVRYQGKVINGIRCISFDELKSSDHRNRRVSVAIAAPLIREKVVRKCEDAGLSFVSLVSPDHRKYDENSIGEGHILCANTMLTSNVVVGRHFHLNIYSYVAHDSVIGDFVTFGPGVRCNGRVHIEDYAYIGTNAAFKQGVEGKPLRVGKGAFVGMGAVVTKDVPPGVTVVGNPARPVAKPMTNAG
jgi:sugar O-acyltransferase (sialic acid O-acetyltransferase NeuD family)